MSRALRPLLASMVFVGACFDARLGASAPPGGAQGSDGERDGGMAEADAATAESDAQGEVRHPACATPRPRLFPPEIERRAALVEDSAFEDDYNAFAAIDCAEITFERCDPEHPCHGADVPCVYGSDVRDGICWVERESYGQPVSFRDGQCQRFTNAKMKARLRCAGVAGFDTRRWPFEQKSGPGETCSRHADCEDGLLCSGELDFGRCACPEVRGTIYDPPALCGFLPPTPHWGQIAYPLALGACKTSSEPGWVIESLGEPGEPGFTAHVGANGELHVLTRVVGQRLMHAKREATGWTTQEVARDVLSFASTVDQGGALHIAVAGSALRYGTFADGAWELMQLPGTPAADGLTITTDANDEPLVLYVDAELGDSHWVRRRGGTWSSGVLNAGGAIPRFVLIDASDRLTIVADQPTRVGIGSLEDLVLSFGANPAETTTSAVLDREGHAWIAWDHLEGYNNETYVGRLVDGTFADVDLIGRENDESLLGERSSPQLALRPSGELIVARRAHEGTLLLTHTGEAFATVVASDEASRELRLVVDAAGEAHIFYAATLREGWDLRHAYRGTCPE